MDSDKPAPSEKLRHDDFVLKLKSQTRDETFRDLLYQDEFVGAKVVAQLLKVGIIDITRAVRMLVVTMCRRDYPLDISDEGIADMLGLDGVAAVKKAVRGMAADGIAWREGKTGQRRKDRRWRIGKRTAESYIRPDARVPNPRRSKHAEKRLVVSSRGEGEETDGLFMKRLMVSSTCRNEETDSLSPQDRSLKDFKRLEGGGGEGAVAGAPAPTGTTTTSAASCKTETTGEAEASGSSPVPSQPALTESLDGAASPISPDEAGRLFTDEVRAKLPNADFVGSVLFDKHAAHLAEALCKSGCPPSLRRSVVRICVAQLAERRKPLREWNPLFAAELVPKALPKARRAAEEEARRADQLARDAFEAEGRRRAVEMSAAERRARADARAAALAADTSEAADYPAPSPLASELDEHFAVVPHDPINRRYQITEALCKFGIPAVVLYFSATFPEDRRMLEAQIQDLAKRTTEGNRQYHISLYDALNATRAYFPDEAERWRDRFRWSLSPFEWEDGRHAPKGLVAAFRRDMAERLKARTTAPAAPDGTAPIDMEADPVVGGDLPAADSCGDEDQHGPGMDGDEHEGADDGDARPEDSSVEDGLDGGQEDDDRRGYGADWRDS